MLATPLLPPSFAPKRSPEETSQYKPARDLEAFSQLLQPIEFVEGSSSGAFAIPEGKYEPINVTPKAKRTESQSITPSSTSSPTKTSTSPATSPTKPRSLHNGFLDCAWLPKSTVGVGMYNTGNTCFLNSALQCLVHTPPLLHVLDAHGKADPCQVRSGFCMICALGEVAKLSHTRRGCMNPHQISSQLHNIAKHMRRGRQEDSHEFLRYAIDALQRSCLAGHPPKLDHKIAETTWVHKIFGGRLRSRVTCHECEHNSDTFDSILDLSLDIFGVSGLRDALRKFVAIDHLRGEDKYKCEKCKKHVIAEKQFTLHDCPLVLTVHLKRFSPLGRKIGHHIRYDERLSLQPFMSEGQFGPTYSLYGVICHAGGGPNSGHYYAYVKGRDGWYEMNDEMVTYHRGAPASLKSAYMLFYLRDRGQALEAAIRSTSVPDPLTPPKVRLAMKKRRVVDSDEETQEDKGVKETVPFIGPILPSPSPSLNVTPEAVKVRPNVDPQAEIVKKKIEALSKSPAALDDLARYESSEADDKDPEPEEEPPSSSQPTMTSSQRSPSLSQSLPQVSSPDHPGQAVPAASFYAMPNGDSPRSWSKKRKSPKWAGDHTSPKRRFNYPAASHSPLKGNKNSNPFSRLKGGDNLHHRPPPKFTYGKKRRMAL